MERVGYYDIFYLNSRDINETVSPLRITDQSSSNSKEENVENEDRLLWMKGRIIILIYIVWF